MKQNKFKIVIPSYNNEKWIEPNLASIVNQSYTNYEVLYIDDCSTDGTYSIVKDIVTDLPNWKVVRNETNMRRGYNLSPYNPLILDFVKDDEDILLFVDGDDWLYEETTLEKLNELYNEEDYWMTYGMFVCYPNGEIGYPQNTPYPDDVHTDNAYRKDAWRASHLRTFKWHLYKQIRKEDLIFTKTGEFYFHAEDLATSFPCLEMCPKDKIGVVRFITYVYNVSQEARARVENDNSREPGGYQYELQTREAEVRNREPYKQLDFDLQITNTLGGGLGNMLFMTAAAYALGKKHNHKLVFNSSHYGILHQHPTSYATNLFRNIALPTRNVENFKSVGEHSFHYTPIEIPKEDVKLGGYFQSPKYFEEYADEIRNLFAPTEEIVSYLKAKYTILQSGNVVSLHLRRGNYLQLSTHHYNLAMDYYLNAINYFKGSNFLVFSDDIEWCKQTFKGSEFTFAEESKDYMDLYLMSLCTHNVIANSTFSWWGAWLNSNPNKTVVYPDKWFGPAYADWKTSDLFPDKWICLTEQVPQLEVNLFDDACRHLAKPNGRYSSVHGKIADKVTFVRDRVEYEGITIFTDGYLKGDVSHVKSKYKIGWLLETREVGADRYTEFPNYMNNYDFVMTHDQELLDSYPQKTMGTIFGGTWINTKNYGVHAKTKNLSMIYSDKQYLTGHKLRHQVASTVPGIDLYGRGTPRPLEYKEEALLDYRYSIIIENSKTNNYFTEKLLDCFAVGTIPIYWGCPNIGNFFDTDGMFIVNSLEEIQQIVGQLNESEYSKRIEHIRNNNLTFRQYAVTEDWMYENILKDLK